MSFNPQKQHRRSIRLAGYDYREAGAYFVTVCAARKRPVFGRIENGVMHPNVYGRIVIEEWERMAELRQDIALDEWVVMPNHFHAIICRGMACHAQNDAQNDAQNTNQNHALITDEGMASHAPTFGRPQSGSLAMVIGGFKGGVTRRINAYRTERGLAPVVVWQRNYYERIIRDETELNHTRRYLIEIPQNWDSDSEHP
jgi:REP element-mobilizing transposase RayT